MEHGVLFWTNDQSLYAVSVSNWLAQFSAFQYVFRRVKRRSTSGTRLNWTAAHLVELRALSKMAAIRSRGTAGMGLDTDDWLICAFLFQEAEQKNINSPHTFWDTGSCRCFVIIIGKVKYSFWPQTAQWRALFWMDTLANTWLRDPVFAFSPIPLIENCLILKSFRDSLPFTIRMYLLSQLGGRHLSLKPGWDDRSFGPF